MNKHNDPPPAPFFTITDKRTPSEHRENGFTVPHKLPSLNEYINACRANRYKGAKLKEDAEALVVFGIMQAQTSGTLRPPKPPMRLAFVWHEKTRRRDADNIASAKKYILDAMQNVGIIPNDSRKYVTGFTDEIIDDDRDFVEVRIIELDGDFADTLKSARKSGKT